MTRNAEDKANCLSKETQLFQVELRAINTLREVAVPNKQNTPQNIILAYISCPSSTKNSFLTAQSLHSEIR